MSPYLLGRLMGTKGVSLGVRCGVRDAAAGPGERCRTRTGTVDPTVPGAPDYALTRYAPRPPEETERETPTPRPRGGGQAERTRETLERRVAARAPRTRLNDTS